MSDPIIELRGVSRVYKLPTGTKWQRILTRLGLSRNPERVQEFWALRDIDLAIAPNRRLGIVGRNGAGKSTLLRVIAGLLTPTEGTAKVKGHVETLMHMGTGFHPDFTGRQNVRSSLAHKGIFGKEADLITEEIMEFAELEEFFDVPIRTYSSGMNARLAFAAATAIRPEILIIDEVLGAGDAYFAGKSYDRMRRLTAAGTTVLFVSHDMGAVEKICDDAIWLERGRIRMTGSTLDISRAYSAHIRRQEQLRAQARNSLMSVANFRKLRNRADRPFQLIVRLVVAQGKSDVYRIALADDAEEVAGVDVGAPQDTNNHEQAVVVLDDELGRWTKPMRDADGRFFRSIRPSKKHAIGSGLLVFNMDFVEVDRGWKLEIEARGAAADVQVFDGEYYRTVGATKAEEAGSTVIAMPRDVIASFLATEGLTLVEAPPLAAGNAEDRPAVDRGAGLASADVVSRAIRITDVAFEDAAGAPRTHFRSFEPMRVRIAYEAGQAIASPEFVVAIYREGICAAQSLSGDQEDSPKMILPGAKGSATLEFPSLSLGRGVYTASVAIFPAEIRTERSSDHIAYALLDRRFEIKVEQPEGDEIDRGIARGRVVWNFSENK